uniref:Integrase core domain containing protein n=1 Tax=Solanum tuberosum TaxID=4113 RepID=M1DW15_SOLTU
MLNVLLESVTFGKKPEVAEGTQRLAESLHDRPLSAPLNPSYTVTFGGLTQFTEAIQRPANYTTRSKAAERIIPEQENAKGITINEDVAISKGKATKLPTTAMHVFLEDSHVTAPSGSGTTVPPEVISSTDAQTQSDASGTDAQTDGATV